MPETYRAFSGFYLCQKDNPRLQIRQGSEKWSLSDLMSTIDDLNLSNRPFLVKAWSP